MPALATVTDLETLLRQQGHGSSIPKPALEAEPPLNTGFSALDRMLGGGWARGELSECCGSTSSGCLTVGLAAIAQATARGELAAYIDATESLDPESAERSGVVLDRLLWVRCGLSQPLGARPTTRASRTWQATNLVAAAGGFGLVVIDLIGLSRKQLRTLQSSPWFGLRQSIAHSSTALLVLTPEHISGSIAAQTLSLERRRPHWRGHSDVSLRLAGMSFAAAVRHQRRLPGRAHASCLLEAPR